MMPKSNWNPILSSISVLAHRLKQTSQLSTQMRHRMSHAQDTQLQEQHSLQQKEGRITSTSTQRIDAAGTSCHSPLKHGRASQHILTLLKRIAAHTEPGTGLARGHDDGPASDPG